MLLKINNHSTDGLSLKEARKLIEASKEKLNLVVRREHKPGIIVENTALPKGKLTHIQNLLVYHGITSLMQTISYPVFCILIYIVFSI